MVTGTLWYNMDAPGRGEAGLAHQCGAGEVSSVREAAEGEVEDYSLGGPEAWVGRQAWRSQPAYVRSQG